MAFCVLLTTKSPKVPNVWPWYLHLRATTGVLGKVRWAVAATNICGNSRRQQQSVKGSPSVRCTAGATKVRVWGSCRIRLDQAGVCDSRPTSQSDRVKANREHKAQSPIHAFLEIYPTEFQFFCLYHCSGFEQAERSPLPIETYPTKTPGHTGSLSKYFSEITCLSYGTVRVSRCAARIVEG